MPKSSDQPPGKPLSNPGLVPRNIYPAGKVVGTSIRHWFQTFQYPPTDPFDDTWTFSISRNSSDEGEYALDVVPGGLFTRWFDIWVPQQTLGEYVLQLSLGFPATGDKMVGIVGMQVVSAGDHIGKSFNRSQVSLLDSTT